MFIKITNNKFANSKEIIVNCNNIIKIEKETTQYSDATLYLIAYYTTCDGTVYESYSSNLERDKSFDSISIKLTKSI